MTEIHFIVEEAPEGGYTARAVGEDMAIRLPCRHGHTTPRFWPLW